MNRVYNILTIIIQIVWTFILSFAIYMFFAILDTNFGIDGLFGLLIIQPIFGAILSILTIGVCLLVGLPIRLNKKINKWWTTNFYISIIGTVFGLALLMLALIPKFNETIKIQLDGQETLKNIPNYILSYTGWFMTAFMTLHFFPPEIIKRKIETILNSNSGRSIKNAL